MNYRNIFQTIQSRYQLEEILLYLHHHPKDFDEVFELAFDVGNHKAWRIMWAIEKISRRNPEWFNQSQIEKIVDMTLTTKNHSELRICLSILNSFPAPDIINVNLLNALYEWMLSPRCPSGIQSSSMKLLYKYVNADSDLLQEFILTLNQSDDSDYTPAFISSKRNILKRYS